MRTVADGSVIVAFLLGEGSGEERDAMLGEVHAPASVDVEVTQTLRGLLRADRIDLATADLGRIELADLPIRRHPDAALAATAPGSFVTSARPTTASTQRSPKAWMRR